MSFSNGLKLTKDEYTILQNATNLLAAKLADCGRIDSFEVQVFGDTSVIVSYIPGAIITKYINFVTNERHNYAAFEIHVDVE